MRAITVRQPWAWAIVHGGKDVENRTRNIAGAYRGLVAIHAAAEWAKTTYREYGQLINAGLPFLDDSTPRGVVLGVVDLTDVHDDDYCVGKDMSRLSALYRRDPAAYLAVPCGPAGGLIGRARMCSPWAMGDHHHLVLANPRPLATPVPAKGRLGLWALPDDVEAAVLAQIRGAA